MTNALHAQICNYLRGKSQPITGKELTSPDDTSEFFIGNELSAVTNGNNFFRIVYKEHRNNHSWPNYTPAALRRTGYLKITSEGDILLLRDDFSPNNEASCKFHFNSQKNELERSIVDKERIVSTCCKGLTAVGFFALAAAVIASSAINQSYKP